MRLRKADGHALRWLREEHWLSQKQLAERAGVARQTIIEIELGRNTSPRTETLFALAEALGVHPDALLEKPIQHTSTLIEESSRLTRLEEDESIPPTFGTG